MQLVLILLAASFVLWFTTLEPYAEQYHKPSAGLDGGTGADGRTLTLEEIAEAAGGGGGGGGGAGGADGTAFVPRPEDSAEYAKLMKEQGVAGEVESEGEGAGEIEKGMEMPGLTEEGGGEGGGGGEADPASSSNSSSSSSSLGAQRRSEPVAVEGGSFRVVVDADAADFVARDDLPPVRDKAFDGGAPWKLTAAARLMKQAEVVSTRPRPDDISAAIAPPCRPVEPAPEGLVDVRPRGKRPPAHVKCRPHDDHPKLAIAVSLGGRPHAPLTNDQIVKAMNTVKELAKNLGGTKRSHVSELLVMLDGVWPKSKELGKMQTIMRGENDWFVVSKTRKGDARQLNKMIRASRADHVLVLTEEDLLGVSESPDRARKMSEWAATAVGIARQANTVALIAADPEPKRDMKQIMLPALEVKHSPILVRRDAVYRVGGFEEWGSCPDDPLTATVVTELVTRLWRSGGSQAALLPASEGAVNPLSEHRTRGTSGAEEGGGGGGGGHAWPFIVPGLTPAEKTEAGEQAELARAGKWKAKPSATVAGNCQPPDLGPNGERPAANEACGVTTHNYPVVTIVMQYFRRPKIVNQLMKSLLNLPFPVEFIINDDSRTEIDIFENFSNQKSELYEWHLALLNDVHEIRGYNRLSLFASSELVYMIQDDDAAPRHPTWVTHAVKLFNKYHLLGVLGGYRGRVDNGRKQIKLLKQNDGDKFGAHPERDKTGATRHIPLRDKEIGVPFMWCYKVNLAPYVVRRSLFAEVGGFNTDFSCAGSPGIGLDFELSIRLWKLGWKVGLFDPAFKHAIGNSKASGTHSGVQRKIRDANEGRNNMMMYQMYPGFHHKKASSIVIAENKASLKRGYFASTGKKRGRR